MRQLADAKQEIEEMSATEHGKLVIGSIPTVAPYFLPTSLATFNRKFPRIGVTVVEEFTTDVLDRLEGGVLDLALLALPVAGSNFLSQEVLRERLYLVVPRDHRLAKQSTIHFKQVEKDPFLLLKEGHCFRDNTFSACGRARLDPNVGFENGQFTTILAMVGAGSGASMVPQMAVESRPGCRFIPSPCGHRTTQAAFSPRRRKLAMIA